jgi:hypothetical protein
MDAVKMESGAFGETNNLTDNIPYKDTSRQQKVP